MKSEHVKSIEINEYVRYAKLFELRTIYEMEDSLRESFIERISCSKELFDKMIEGIIDEKFRKWVLSIAPVIWNK